MAITTWVLTGLLVSCLINSVPAVKTSLVGAAASVLEIELEDDDKDDPRELDFALFAGMDHRGSTKPWYDAADRVPSQAVRTQSETNLVRGPPCC